MLREDFCHGLAATSVPGSTNGPDLGRDLSRVGASLQLRRNQDEGPLSLKKSALKKTPAEKVVKGIRRATRRHFSAEYKIRIVLDGL